MSRGQERVNEGGYDQNSLFTCVKLSKNKLKILYFKKKALHVE